jgi:hypothetical protein
MKWGGLILNTIRVKDKTITNTLPSGLNYFVVPYFFDFINTTQQFVMYCVSHVGRYTREI